MLLSTFFHLECTNFVAKSTVGVLSLRGLQDALVETLEYINVNLVKFVACHFLVSYSIPNNLLLWPVSIYLTDQFYGSFPDKFNCKAHFKAFC